MANVPANGNPPPLWYDSNIPPLDASTRLQFRRVLVAPKYTLSCQPYRWHPTVTLAALDNSKAYPPHFIVEACEELEQGPLAQQLKALSEEQLFHIGWAADDLRTG